MHGLSKKIALLLTVLLEFSILLPLVQVRAPLGSILIGVTAPPSPVFETKLGGNVSLYFGPVVWYSEQGQLFISPNGYHAVNWTVDIAYGPLFSVAKITSTTIDTTTYEGYSVGNNWINGTIPTTLKIPPGNYYIKAFEGTQFPVDVTDNYITIKASFEMTVHVQRRLGDTPIGGAEVAIFVLGELIDSATTDENGTAYFGVQAGYYTIVVSRHLFGSVYVTKTQIAEITEDTTVVFTFII